LQSWSPFDTSDANPGYINGYPPGVRENGEQYTHAAIWAAMAFADLGDSQRAWECFSMINPVHHGSSASQVVAYKVEPYVMAADVYAVHPHTGQGGWTWYTGSASWMYRLVIESLLGMRLQANVLHFAPCLPADWAGFAVQYRFGATLYNIDVKLAAGDASPCVLLNGVPQPTMSVALHDDRLEHQVQVCLGVGGRGQV
jgi:cyclic beta-1,2-glucan synthetase